MDNIHSFDTLPKIFQDSPSKLEDYDEEEDDDRGEEMDNEGSFSYLDDVTEMELVSLDEPLHVNEMKDDAWSKFKPLSIDKDESLLSNELLLQCIPVPDMNMEETNDKKKRKISSVSKKTKRNINKKKQKVKSAFSSVTFFRKTPKYVVRCGDNPPRFGVKMKLCNQNVRIGCNYADMCSAAQIALEAKKRIVLTPSKNFKLKQSDNKSLMRVSVFIKDKVVKRSINCILCDFISVFNAKRSWKSENYVQPTSSVISTSSAEDSLEFESELSKIEYVEDFPTKIRKLRDGYVRDLVSMYENLGKARCILSKAVKRYESDDNISERMIPVLRLLKRCVGDISDLMTSLREGSRFNASVLGASAAAADSK